MTIKEVPVLPFRASRHLGAWIVWHTSGVSLIDDAPVFEPPPAKAKPAKRRRRRRA